MLQLSQTFYNRPIMSLRIGSQVATAQRPIINPDNLKIEGFYATNGKQSLILVSQDIRDIAAQGIIIDDFDVLVEPGDLVRLQDVIRLHFDLLGLPVITSQKHRLGKVNDFAADPATMYIQKIYVAQSIFKSFSGGNLGIDRSQIVEITDKSIVVQDLTEKVSVGASVLAS